MNNMISTIEKEQLTPLTQERGFCARRVTYTRARASRNGIYFFFLFIILCQFCVVSAGMKEMTKEICS